MGSRWGDDVDEELQQRHQRLKVGFVFNFMQISKILKRIEEETREWDEKYPKSELLKIWGSTMVFLLIFMTLSYNILIIVTGLFMLLNIIILFQVFGVWKRFHYSVVMYWLMTIVGLAVVFLIGWLLRGLIFG